MRASFLFHGLAFIACWLGSALVANASHNLGTELTYEYAGTPANPNQYHVVARLIRDLSSGVDDVAIPLTCGKEECGNTLPGSFIATLTRTSSTPVLTGCASGYSYAADILEGTVNLVPAHWTLSINVSNRQRGVVNIASSDMFSSYVKAELNNTNGLINSSPRFTTARIIQLTSSQPQRYSANAFDAEGDSLVYQLVRPLATPDAAEPCGFATTGAIAPHFQLNAASGELLTISGPTQLGFYAMAVRVNEYRRLNGTWQPIGSITRDMNYIVSTGTNQPPTFTRVARTGSPGTQLLGQTIRVNPGQTLSLALIATDADAGQALTLASNIPSLVPGSSFQNLGSGQGQLVWQVPTTFPLGRYYLTVTASDNACLITGAEVVTIPVLVTQQVLATHTRQALAQPPFPAPFSAVVRFQFAEQGIQPVTITDALGRKVAQFKTTQDGSAVWQPAATLSAGLYFARNADGTQVARLQYRGN
jgi:hypothetical protein